MSLICIWMNLSKTHFHMKGFALGLVLKQRLRELGNGQLSVVKQKPKQLQWSITTNANSTMNQWELEAKTRNQREARENARDKVVIGLGFVYVARIFFNQSLSIVKQNRSNSGLLWTFNWKPLLYLNVSFNFSKTNLPDWARARRFLLFTQFLDRSLSIRDGVISHSL